MSQKKLEEPTQFCSGHSKTPKLVHVASLVSVESIMQNVFISGPSLACTVDYVRICDRLKNVTSGNFIIQSFE
jgi:hypothetical protein